jgi:hypothetical protein
LFHPVDPLGSLHSFRRTPWLFSVRVRLVFTRREGSERADVGMHDSVNVGSAFVNRFPSRVDGDRPVVPAMAPRFTRGVEGWRGHGMLMSNGGHKLGAGRRPWRGLWLQFDLGLKPDSSLLGPGRKGLVRLARPCSCAISWWCIDLQPVQPAIQVRIPLRTVSPLALCSLFHGLVLRKAPRGFGIDHHRGRVAGRRWKSPDLVEGLDSRKAHWLLLHRRARRGHGDSIGRKLRRSNNLA